MLGPFLAVRGRRDDGIDKVVALIPAIVLTVGADDQLAIAGTAARTGLVEVLGASRAGIRVAGAFVTYFELGKRNTMSEMCALLSEGISAIKEEGCRISTHNNHTSSGEEHRKGWWCHNLCW